MQTHLGVFILFNQQVKCLFQLDFEALEGFAILVRLNFLPRYSGPPVVSQPQPAMDPAGVLHGHASFLSFLRRN